MNNRILSALTSLLLFTSIESRSYADSTEGCKIPKTAKTCETKKREPKIKSIIKPVAIKPTVAEETPSPKISHEEVSTTKEKSESLNKNYIIIDQRQYNDSKQAIDSLEHELNDARHELDKVKAELNEAQSRAQRSTESYRRTKKAYKLLKEKSKSKSCGEEICRERECNLNSRSSCASDVQSRDLSSAGGEGFYLGLVLGAGPDGVVYSENSELSGDSYKIYRQEYKPFFGGRLMGVARSGYAAGVQYTTNRSISIDFDIRLK